MTERSEVKEGNLFSTAEKLLDDKTELTEMEKYFDKLYGERDAIFLPGRELREQLLYRGISDLGKAVRKSAGQEVYETMCARVVSRVFCVARGVDYVSVADGLGRKYPIEGCSYCGEMPCTCPEDRNDSELSDLSVEQANWSLRDWQTHLTKMYGENNLNHGVQYALLRLGEEYGELLCLERTIAKLPIEEVKFEYALELGDTMAWTIAVASMLGVDLQKAVGERYGKGCSVCEQKPCMCPPHSFDQASLKIVSGGS